VHHKTHTRQKHPDHTRDRYHCPADSHNLRSTSHGMYTSTDSSVDKHLTELHRISRPCLNMAFFLPVMSIIYA
jgi:hypothetical protein